MKTCASCTADIADSDGVMRPLGRNGMDVMLCIRCDTEHPRSGRYGFDDSGPAPVCGSSVVRRDGNRRMGDHT